MVVPLANIMDVGFIVLSPSSWSSSGSMPPLFMLGLCLVAIVTGFAISYNIRHYEPLIGQADSLHRISWLARWSLLGASIANLGYYAMLMTTLILLPLDLYSEGSATTWAIVVLAGLGLVGYVGKLEVLNRAGDQTTAFNLAASITTVWS